MNRRQFLKYAWKAAFASQFLPKKAFADDRLSVLEEIVDCQHVDKLKYEEKPNEYLIKKREYAVQENRQSEEYGHMILFMKDNVYRLLKPGEKRKKIAELPKSAVLAHFNILENIFLNNVDTHQSALLQHKSFGDHGKSTIYTFEQMYKPVKFDLWDADKKHSYIMGNSPIRMKSKLAYECSRAQQYFEGETMKDGTRIDNSNYLDLHPTVFHFLVELNAKKEQVLASVDKARFDTSKLNTEHLYSISELISSLSALASLMPYTWMTGLDQSIVRQQLEDLEETVPDFFRFNNGRIAYHTLIKYTKTDRSKGISVPTDQNMLHNI